MRIQFFFTVFFIALLSNATFGQVIELSNTRLYTSDSLGIGVGPGARLHVKDDILISRLALFPGNSVTPVLRLSSQIFNAQLPIGGIVSRTGSLSANVNSRVFAMNAEGSDMSVVFTTNNQERMRITQTGNVGINTTNPQAALHILKAGIPVAGLPASQNGLLLGIQSTSGYKWIQSYGGVLALNPVGNGVAIGTTAVPVDYKLAIDGKIVAEEIKVQLSQNWPDYVFDKHYKLMPLEDVDQFIKENGHLPNMPSAREIEQEGGIELGEMQRKIVEKVEELTRYMIALKEENDMLKAEITTLKKH